MHSKLMGILPAIAANPLFPNGMIPGEQPALEPDCPVPGDC